MKFRVTMKDPDALYDAVGDAIEADVKERFPGALAHERETLLGMARDRLHAAARPWFGGGDYLTVEIDTDARTCTVVAE